MDLRATEKDTQVLAGAIKGKADILISLDRGHILNKAVQKAFPLPIMSPGDFLQQYGLIEPKPDNHQKKTGTRKSK